MQINLFNGGLNTRVSPFLVQASESVECNNIDPTSGSLEPVKIDKNLQRKTKDNCYFFKGAYVETTEDRDYVEFQDKLYYSNGVTKPHWSHDGFSWYQLGIDKPTEDSLKVTLTNNNTGLNIKPLYGYYEEGDERNVYEEEFLSVYGINTLLNFEDDSVREAYPLGAHKQIEFIKNIPSKIFESGETSKSNFYKGEATLYHKVEDTSSSYAAVICRQRTVVNFPPPFVVKGETCTPLIAKFANVANWYVKTDKDDMFRAKAVRSAAKGYDKHTWFNAGYVSSQVGDYSAYPDMLKPHFIKPKSIIVMIIKDKDGEINSILSDVVPEQLDIVHTPTAGGMTYFAGFSFEWRFQQTDIVDIYSDGAFVASRTYKDIVRNQRVFVESKCIDRVKTQELAPILEKLKEIQYVITYSNGSNESQPSSIRSVPFLSGDNKTIYPNIAIKHSDDPQVSSIKLYRRGGGISEFSFVKEFDNIDSTFVDTSSNFDLDGAVLDSYNNTPAPAGLRHLTISNVMMFGSIADKLYYTDVARPYVWSGFNFIDFDDTITGLGDTPNGLLVFTRTKTYVVTGNSPSTLSKYLLSGDIGCILHKSIKAISNNSVWLSESGICVSNGGSVSIVSQNKLRAVRLTSPRVSAVLRDVYYLSHAKGTLVLDLRFGQIFYSLSEVYKSLQAVNGVLFGVNKANDYVEVCAGDSYARLTYHSPNYSDGSVSNLKTYKPIYIHSTGDLTIEVFIDGKSAIRSKLNDGVTEVKTPQSEMKGYYISFRVEGTGVLNEIEYKVEARQNGR